MGKYFGTDGIRGLSNTPPMDVETALKVGMAAGAYFRNGSHKHRVIIGKDTRLSSYMIENALTAGFISMGMEVFLVGPMPTPAVAVITRSMRADVGVMISASHNPYQDNGIKLFRPNGLKLSDEAEAEIEKLIDSDLNSHTSEPSKLGRAKRIDDAAGRYIEYVKQTFPKRKNLEGLKIALDCSNGAAYKIAPIVFWELGADVISISTEPNGFNINDNCGSTHPELISQKVIETGADIGISLDGDSDRLIVCDEKGKIIDGDQIMAAIAENWNSRNRLSKRGIVTTVMSNMGLEEFLNSQGLKLERTKVGDRHVIQKMQSEGYNLGGEQSGHIIFNDFTTTGDGILAALQVLAALVDSQKPANEVLNVFDPYPQILKNIRYNKNKICPLENDNIKDSINQLNNELGTKGRIVVRKSGTEPLIRIMVEGKESGLIEAIPDKIADEINLLNISA